MINLLEMRSYKKDSLCVCCTILPSVQPRRTMTRFAQSFVFRSGNRPYFNNTFQCCTTLAGLNGSLFQNGIRRRRCPTFYGKAFRGVISCSAVWFGWPLQIFDEMQIVIRFRVVQESYLVVLYDITSTAVRVLWTGPTPSQIFKSKYVLKCMCKNL